jgi:hypothetical protein
VRDRMLSNFAGIYRVRGPASRATKIGYNFEIMPLT